MTTTTTDPTGRPVREQAAFTLVELMIAAGLTGLVLAGVISAFLFMGRSGANASSYVGMETEARQALEQFGEDVRMAYAVGQWSSSQRLKLYMTSKNTADATKDIQYYYDGVATSPTYRCLLRAGPNRITGAAETRVLIHHVEPDLAFTGWNRGATPSKVTGGATVDPAVIWQLQLGLTIKIKNVTAAAASNLVVSARYIMRNKS